MKNVALLFGVVAITLVGCKNGEKTEASSEDMTETVDSTVVDSHNSETSLDWAGVYEGTTPCADCDGIKTVVELKDDKTYILSQTYLSDYEDKKAEIGETGTFTWDETGSKITLNIKNGTLKFKVGENQLTMLDLDGNVVTGDLADFYILKKTVE
ncbi:copper resistance protein NlpE [Aequorivita sp. F47161]|uniref:Copper resistance protein NlpE n=1 Tax=Aequorivita vitellina TaxID=2874475 RepID=A0A9X1TZD2_9FLAO|nr:copper resistance protein NlpE [Aequorivita vitellina]MCG2417964.1 copper resistance protein NlpE [Aequorivita vitellina]